VHALSLYKTEFIFALVQLNEGIGVGGEFSRGIVSAALIGLRGGFIPLTAGIGTGVAADANGGIVQHRNMIV
jgi:hypothetical protein